LYIVQLKCLGSFPGKTQTKSGNYLQSKLDFLVEPLDNTPGISEGYRNIILFSSSFGSSGGLGITAIMPIDNVVSIASFTSHQF
jgi:hypothetical protein